MSAIAEAFADIFLQGALGIADAATMTNINLIGPTGQGTGQPNVCILKLTATDGTDCTASVNCPCSGTTTNYPIASCVPNGNNSFVDPTVGPWAVFYYSDIYGYTGGQFPGYPMLYHPSSKNTFNVDYCAGQYDEASIIATSCSGQQFQMQICVGLYQNWPKTNSDEYFVALPFEGHTSSC